MKYMLLFLLCSITLLALCLHYVGNQNVPVHAAVAHAAVVQAVVVHAVAAQAAVAHVATAHTVAAQAVVAHAATAHTDQQPLGFCRDGQRAAKLSHGVLEKTFAGVLIYAVHGIGRIVSPQDDDVYSLVIQDFGSTIYTNRNIHAGSAIALDYSTPWWKLGIVNINIVFKCISNPDKTADMVFYGSGCVN
jgi:hypothetical protein